VRIELGFSEDVAIVRLSGKFLAGSDGPFLRQKVNDLIDAGGRKLILNFEEVPYIDSTGLGFLAGSHKAAQAAGVSVILASLNQHVRKVLDNVQLSQFFVIAESEAEALARFKESGQPADDKGAGGTKPARTRKRSPNANA
jgi:anti-anti-sigma factor